MRRVVVVGCSGSGKSTLAATLAARFGVAHIELDSLWHLPGWEHRSPEEFRALLAEAMADAGDGWVISGNYATPSQQIHLDPTRKATADTVVWLDLPRRTIMRRIVWRTLRRVVTREELWNGLREPWSNLYSLDPERNIIVWAWTTHEKYRRDYGRQIADRSWAHLDVHRLTTPAEVESFLGSVHE